VRLALGATVDDIHWMILREGARLVAIGVVAGAGVSLAAAGKVGGMLFLHSPRDVLTFTLVPAILAVVGVVACWIPAIRATNVDPSVALRDE
jgi:putative ABC transport system permease protein